MKAPTNRKLKAARDAVDQAFKAFELKLRLEGMAEADLESAKTARYDAGNYLHRCLREREAQVRLDERSLVRKEPVRQPCQKAPQKAKG